MEKVLKGIIAVILALVGYSMWGKGGNTDDIKKTTKKNANSINNMSNAAKLQLGRKLFNNRSKRGK